MFHDNGIFACCILNFDNTNIFCLALQPLAMILNYIFLHKIIFYFLALQFASTLSIQSQRYMPDLIIFAMQSPNSNVIQHLPKMDIFPQRPAFGSMFSVARTLNTWVASAVSMKMDMGLR
jgi:hypothetical protein